MATPYSPTPRLLTSITFANDGDEVDEAYAIVPTQRVYDVASIAQATYAKNFTLQKVKNSNPFVCAVAAGMSEGKRCWVIAGGDSDSSDSYLAFSRDGQSWAEQANPRYTTIQAAAYSPALDMWALVGDAIAGDAYILTSPNGRAPFTERSNPAAEALNALCVGPSGEFIAAGDNGYLLRSVDGITWAQLVAPGVANIGGLTYANGLFVAFGSQIWTSADGINWVLRANPGYSSPGHGVAYNGRYFCGITVAGEIVRSQYGLSWAVVRPDVDFGAWKRPMAADPETGIFLAAGNTDTGLLISIDDGATWVSFTDIGAHDGVTNNPVMALTYGHGRFMLGGQHGTVGRGLIR